jgi:hypothetical protein
MAKKGDDVGALLYLVEMHDLIVVYLIKEQTIKGNVNESINIKQINKGFC